MLMRIVLTKADVDVTFNGHIESSLKIADNLVPRLRIFCTYYFVQSTKYRTCMYYPSCGFDRFLYRNVNLHCDTVYLYAGIDIWNCGNAAVCKYCSGMGSGGP